MEILDFIKRKPFYLFLIVGLFFLIISFFPIYSHTLDINIHDTYFVIPVRHFLLLWSVIMFVFFTIYFMSVRFSISTNKWFQNIHIFGSLFFVLLFSNFSFFYDLFQDPKDLFSNSEFYLNIFFFVIVILFVMLQIIWILYLIFLLFKKLLKKT